MLFAGAHEKQVARDEHIHPAGGGVERESVNNIHKLIEFVRVRTEPSVVLRLMNPDFRRFTEKCTFLK